MIKKDAIIVDLEGTLTNCTHRIHHYENKNYDEWNKLFSQDTVNESMVEIINRHKVNGIQIIMFTAKSSKYSTDVMKWLQENDLLDFFDSFYFRPEDDKRPSTEVKKEMLLKASKRFSVLMAYDDREDICQMYHSQQIPSYLFIPDNHKTPANFLEEAAQMFKEKNKEYGNSYKTFGKIMMSYFPKGLKLKTEKDFTRFSILNIMISKADRYCKNFTTGGHEDSLTDLSVYSAMLKEIDNG